MPRKFVQRGPRRVVNSKVGGGTFMTTAASAPWERIPNWFESLQVALEDANIPTFYSFCSISPVTANGPVRHTGLREESHWTTTTPAVFQSNFKPRCVRRR